MDDAVEEFAHILVVAIGEEKILMNFTVSRITVLLH